MNSELTPFHQLGKFIYSFQSIESSINHIMMLLLDTDDEMACIVTNELNFSQKLNAVRVMFYRFIDIREKINPIERTNFDKLISKIYKLCERRNKIVHSSYDTWQDIEGRIGLLRENSKLRPNKGIREKSEEELLPESFENDANSMAYAISELDKFKLKITNWLCEEYS